MANIFKNRHILIVNDLNSSRKTLVGVLRLLGVETIDEACACNDGIRKLKEKSYDAVISSLKNGTEDAVALTQHIRSENKPICLTPVIAMAGPETLNLVDPAREAGVTDLLQCPFTVDDVSDHLKYVFSLKNEALEQAAWPQEKPVIEEEVEPWADAEEAFSLTNMLLEHYQKHHEVVFAKLKFAQSATRKSLAELRAVHQKVRQHDNTNIHQFSDFDQMWEDILKIFVAGGLSEDDISKIERIITTIPEDIKKHYDGLSQQDKSFIAMVEGLNMNAYKKAKERVAAFQKQPNPLNGKTSDDYAQTRAQETQLISEDAFIFERPLHRQ